VYTIITPITTTDFLYLRFIGDRSIQEKDYGKIQTDKIIEMKRWASQVKKAMTKEGRGRKSINIAIASANNHYAGFGPETANIFRKMVSSKEARWRQNMKDREEKGHASNSIQHSKKKYSDYMT
jgi:uncharacterized protein YecE (DUF72 family)